MRGQPLLRWLWSSACCIAIIVVVAGGWQAPSRKLEIGLAACLWAACTVASLAQTRAARQERVKNLLAKRLVELTDPEIQAWEKLHEQDGSQP